MVASKLFFTHGKEDRPPVCLWRGVGYNRGRMECFQSFDAHIHISTDSRIREPAISRAKLDFDVIFGVGSGKGMISWFQKCEFTGDRGENREGSCKGWESHFGESISYRGHLAADREERKDYKWEDEQQKVFIPLQFWSLNIYHLAFVGGNIPMNCNGCETTVEAFIAVCCLTNERKENTKKRIS